MTIEKLVPNGLLISRKWLIEKGFTETRIDHLVRAKKLTSQVGKSFMPWVPIQTLQGKALFRGEGSTTG